MTTHGGHYDMVHLGDIYGGVTGLFGIRDDGGCARSVPVLLRHGDICTPCWMRDEQVRPVASALCPHGGGAA